MSATGSSSSISYSETVPFMRLLAYLKLKDRFSLIAFDAVFAARKTSIELFVWRSST